MFSDEESAATADGDGSRPRTALPSAAAVEEDQDGEEQGDDGEDAAQDSTDQEEQEGESADGPISSIARGCSDVYKTWYWGV